MRTGGEVPVAMAAWAGWKNCVTLAWDGVALGSAEGAFGDARGERRLTMVSNP